MTKKEARQQVKEWMKKLDKNYIEKADQSIFKQIKELKEFREAKTIFCYASMKNVGVPLCIGKGIMEVRQVHALEDFEEGAYGIMEPSRNCTVLSKEKIDMAVIPCVSADKEGRRLGHGAGFYDRFLDGATFPKILVCYKELMMDQVPTEEHDILMDQVICDE